MVYATHEMGVLNVGDYFPPVIKDVRGTYKSYSVKSLESTDCIGFPLYFVLIRRVIEGLPGSVSAVMERMHKKLYFNDIQVRELQEHYLSTKGWRNDTESSLSRVLANEIDRERQGDIFGRYFPPAKLAVYSKPP